MPKLKIFFKQFLPTVLLHKKKVPQCFCSEDEFLTILKRERERSDRSGQIFALIVFDPPQKDFKDIADRFFLRSIIRRLRSIDEVGWIDGHHIGVLLPGSDHSGAAVFAKTIQTLNAEAIPQLSHSIFIYPNNHQNNFRDKGTNPDKSNLFQIQNRYLKNMGIFFKDLPDIHNSTLPQGVDQNQSDSSMEYLLVRKMPSWKRGMDIMGSFLGLLLLSPLFFVLAAFIKLTSTGPVFFKQERVGYGGSAFTLYKFRTMKHNSDTERHKQYLSDLIHNSVSNQYTQKPMNKLEDDPQIIPFGQILRKTCLDELPQLLNVLLGEMSLVGPRPPIPYEVEEYISWHKERFDIVPGMTGLWQVSGKNSLTFRQMVSLDIQYIKHLSFLFDIKILFKTPYAIAKQILTKTFSSQLEKQRMEQNA